MRRKRWDESEEQKVTQQRSAACEGGGPSESKTAASGLRQYHGWLFLGVQRVPVASRLNRLNLTSNSAWKRLKRNFGSGTGSANVCYGFCSYAVRVSRERRTLERKHPPPSTSKPSHPPLASKMFWLSLPLSGVLLLVGAQQKCFVFLWVSACWRGRSKTRMKQKLFPWIMSCRLVHVYWPRCAVTSFVIEAPAELSSSFDFLQDFSAAEVRFWGQTLPLQETGTGQAAIWLAR